MDDPDPGLNVVPGLTVIVEEPLHIIELLVYDNDEALNKMLFSAECKNNPELWLAFWLIIRLDEAWKVV